MAQHAIEALQVKDFVVTYNLQSETNIFDLEEDLKIHDHEEADTLLILHAINVARRDPFNECIVFSPDTDVFLLLIHYAESLPQVTNFRTGREQDFRDININKCYEAIGTKLANSILGFHTFTGCDQTGRFNGKSKSSWWKIFMKADDRILDALSQLGLGETLPNLDTLQALQYFVVQAY